MAPRNDLSFRLRMEFRSFRRALASIWRMRSRVTAKLCPTSSSVCSLPSSNPKRILTTFSSRGVKVFNTASVCSLNFIFVTISAGDITPRSSMKSPRCEYSSSPMGVSSEIGLRRHLHHFAHLADGNIHPLGNLLRGGLSSQFLHQLTRGADQLVDVLDHVDRNADDTRLVGDGAGDGLTNPPGEHRWKTCSRAGIQTSQPPSSGRCFLPESDRGTAGRDSLYFFAMETTRRRFASTNSRFRRLGFLFRRFRIACMAAAELKRGIRVVSCVRTLRMRGTDLA